MQLKIIILKNKKKNKKKYGYQTFVSFRFEERINWCLESKKKELLKTCVRLLI